MLNTPLLLLPNPTQTITDLNTQLTRKMWLADPTLTTPSETIIYDQVFTSDSCDFCFDLAQVGFSGARWTKLVRQYLPVHETLNFVSRAEQILKGESKPGAIAGLLARPSHSHYGNCIQGFTFRGLRTARPQLTMHSRVTYVGYMAPLDLALAYKLAEEVARRVEIPTEQITFRWCVDSLQFHAIRTLPYLLTKSWFHKDLDDLHLQKLAPAIKNARLALRSIEASGGDWGPGRRVRRLIKGCPRRSFPLESLSLDCLCKVS